MLRNQVSAVWKYRGFIAATIKRDFEVRYLNSALGALWSVINPLALISIYTLVFSQIMSARLPYFEGTYAYSIHLCTGIILWSLFSDITVKAQAVFLEHANLIKKMSFPRICLPIVVVGNGLINFAIISALFAAVLALVGALPGIQALALVPIAGLTAWFAIALGVSLGILNVFFRDVGHFFSVILQFWFWLTPIVYPVSILPPRAESFMMFNPLAGLIVAARDVLLTGDWPDWRSLWVIAALALLLSIIAVRLYLRHGAEMQDEL
jgi:lipopolysaccharide transport system permease protein